MTVEDIKQQKEHLRAQVRAAERQLEPEYRRASEEIIIRRVTQLPEYRRAQSVCCFVGTPREIDTTALLHDILAQGKRLCVPLCVGAGVMELCWVQDLAQLIPGSYGILEPKADAQRVEEGAVGLMIVPCVTCDHTGRRLGQGGGYFDRYCAGRTGDAVLLCRERLIRTPIPMEPFDQGFATVVTEVGVYR